LIKINKSVFVLPAFGNITELSVNCHNVTIESEKCSFTTSILTSFVAYS